MKKVLILLVALLFVFSVAYAALISDEYKYKSFGSEGWSFSYLDTISADGTYEYPSSSGMPGFHSSGTKQYFRGVKTFTVSVVKNADATGDVMHVRHLKPSATQWQRATGDSTFGTDTTKVVTFTINTKLLDAVLVSAKLDSGDVIFVSGEATK